MGLQAMGSGILCWSSVSRYKKVLGSRVKFIGSKEKWQPSQRAERTEQERSRRAQQRERGKGLPEEKQIPFVVVLLCFVFKTGFLCIAMAVVELRSVCLCLPSSRIKVCTTTVMQEADYRKMVSEYTTPVMPMPM